MSYHGLDPRDPNNWYQSRQLGLFPVRPAGYGGGISGACYLTHSSHPHSSPSYPPPPPFPFQTSCSPPPPTSQTIINGYVFPHQFPCVSQTHAQFSPPPQLQPIYPTAQQPLTTTPHSPSIPHSNPNPWIYPLISQSHSCDPPSQFVSTKPMTTTPISHSARSPPVCEKPHSPPQGSGKLQVHKQHTEAKLCEMRESLKSSMDAFLSEFREELRLLKGSLRSPTSQVDNPLKFGSPPPSSTPQLIPAAIEASSSLISADNGIIRTTPVDNDLNLSHTDVILGFNDNTSMDNVVGFVCGTKLNGIDEKIDTGDGENSDEMVKVNSRDAREFNKLEGVTPGTNPYSIKKGIGKTVQAVINELENKSRLVKGCNDFKAVTSMPAGNDKQLGTMIVAAIDKARQKPKEKPDFSVPLIKDESILVESTKLLVPGALDLATILHSNSNGSYHEADSGYQLHSPTSYETESSKGRDLALDGLWDDSSGLPTMKTKFKSFCKPGDDVRLRNYGLVDVVVSISYFEVEISWLDLQNNGDKWVASWENMGLHVPCGRSKVTQQTTTNLVYIISHVVDCDRAAGEIYLIYPKKEFVWALYNEATFDSEGRNLLGVKEKRCYDIVVFLTSYSEMHSLSMGYLDLISAIKKFLSDTIEPWLDETFSGNGFLHDSKWGGIVTEKGLAASGADYNDHHYHLGYLIYAISVLSKIDLAWGKKYRPQAYSLDQKPNSQQGFSYFGILPVILNKVFSFSSEMHCFSLVTTIFNVGIATIVQPFSRDYPVHQLWPPLMMMRCFSLPLSLLDNDYCKSTLLITDVTRGDPYLFDVVVLHFLCQTKASSHPRRFIVDEVIDFLKSHSKLSCVRYTSDALLSKGNCVGFLTNMHKFFQHMVGHVHKDELFMAMCSSTSYPPFHALVKKLFVLSPVVANHSLRPLLVDMLRDDAQFIFGIMMVVSMDELMFLRSKKQGLEIGYSDIDNGNYCSSMSCSLHLPDFMITWFFEFTSVAIDFGDLALIAPQHFSVPMRSTEAPSLILLFRVIYSQAIEFVNSSHILQGPNREASRIFSNSHVGVHFCALMHVCVFKYCICLLKQRMEFPWNYMPHNEIAVFLNWIIEAWSGFKEVANIVTTLHTIVGVFDAADNSSTGADSEKMSERDLIGDIIKTLLYVVSEIIHVASDNLDSFSTYWPPSRYDIDTTNENCHDSLEDICIIARLVLGLACSFGAMHSAGVHDAISKIKDTVMISWVQDMNILVQGSFHQLLQWGITFFIFNFEDGYEFPKFWVEILAIYLVTMKPIICVINVAESDIAEPGENPHVKEVMSPAFELQSGLVQMSAQVQLVLASNSPDLKGTGESLVLISKKQGWKQLFSGHSINYLKFVASVVVGFTVSVTWHLIKGVKEDLKTETIAALFKDVEGLSLTPIAIESSYFYGKTTVLMTTFEDKLASKWLFELQFSRMLFLI